MPQSHIEVEFDDGALDAFVACPDGAGPRPPILLFGDRGRLTEPLLAHAKRLSAHDYFVLAPDFSGQTAEGRRDAAWACLDHLADDPNVDDARVGVVGFGSGGDLAIDLVGSRAERIAVAGDLRWAWTRSPSLCGNISADQWVRPSRLSTGNLSVPDRVA